MPVKPDHAHARTWDESRLTLALGWQEELTTEQILCQLHSVKKQLMAMPEIREAYAMYFALPYADNIHLLWRFTYDPDVVGNDTESQRQELRQRLEDTVTRRLQGQEVLLEMRP